MTQADHEQPHSKPEGERDYWLDKPSNVDRLVKRFYAVCAVLLAIDFLVPKHSPFRIEHYWGFYGIFGFIACVALVLIAKELRRVLMRSEDYYDR